MLLTGSAALVGVGTSRLVEREQVAPEPKAALTPAISRSAPADASREDVVVVDTPAERVLVAAPTRWVSGDEGDLALTVNARSSYDRYTSGEHWEWLRTTFDRMVVFEPYWDSRLAEYDDVLVYRNAYGISVDTRLDRRATEHPEWILRDSSGTPVHIPFACEQRCPRYAADVGDPAFRAHFIEYLRDLDERGYRGVMLDDVNFESRFGTSTGEPTTPIDPRTGHAMQLEAWRTYFAEFLEEIRVALPDTEIMLNMIWFADSPALDDPAVERAIRSADIIALERGYNDAGLEGGDGRWGMRTFMAAIDRIHELGAAVVLIDKSASGDAAMEYNLAGALLTNAGRDAITSDAVATVSPPAMWSGFSIDLGAALGPRTTVGALHRRDFESGIVLFNEPDAATATVELSRPMVTLTGEIVTAVTLRGREAVVLRDAGVTD